MIEFLTQHLDVLIGLITSGGLASIVTLRSTKKQAEAKAMQSMQAVYQETIKDLREDKELMKIENEELRKSIQELRKKVNDIHLELASIRRYKCTVPNCEKRQIE